MLQNVDDQISHIISSIISVTIHIDEYDWDLKYTWVYLTGLFTKFFDFAVKLLSFKRLKCHKI